ncbi:MAG: putative ATPase [Rhodocyclaceae bacterium]|nr:MAG: putative ATPase [Rhodocyclaceae bacterium]
MVGALLSRAQVYVLKSLDEAGLAALLERALSLGGLGIALEEEGGKLLLAQADGDGRRLLNLLEQLATAMRAAGRESADAAFVGEALAPSRRRFDKGGDAFYDQISALHKSVRGSNPDASLYWFCRMLDGGADPLYLGRRILRMAVEDVGLADPRALNTALEAVATYERLGSPEGELALAQAVIYLACAPKSNAVYAAFGAAKRFVAEDGSRPVPVHLRNAPTKLMKELGFGREYRYAHDEPEAYAAGERYFPDELPRDPRFYQPTPRGVEARIGERLAHFRQLDRAAGKQDAREDD